MLVFLNTLENTFMKKFKHPFYILCTLIHLLGCSKKELTEPYPTTPIGLKIANISNSNVTLNWEKSANTNSYKLYRDDIWIYQGNSLNYIDPNLKFNTKYKYNISSLNSSWESPKSGSVYVELKDSLLVKPNPPKGFKLSELASTSIKLTWDKVEFALKYILYRDNKKISETELLEYKDISLKPSTVYHYTITASNNGGESVGASHLFVKTKDNVLASPKDLKAIDVTSSQIKLTWAKVDSTIFYNVYRNGVKIEETKTNEFLDVKLTPNTTYEYNVSANILEGEGTKSESLFVKTKKEDDPESQHLILGNPTNASTNLADEDNFLILKKQFALSYNNRKHIANWVSWELSKTWLGTTPRQDDFRPDTSLPPTWYKTVYNDYTNTGFDRGHLCPSADRTATLEDNSTTFLMTNIVPQAPKLNRESWAFFEDYCRMILDKGYKAYIISGTLGIGGTGNNGFSNTIKNNVAVPKHLYKIALFVKEGAETFTNAKVIAIKVPNSDPETDNVNWLNFVTSVSEIESSSNCVFFTALPQNVQALLKSQIFDISKNPFGIDPPISLFHGSVVFETSKHEKYYISNFNQRVFIK